MSKLGVRGVDIPGVLGSVLEPRGPNVLPLFEFSLADAVFVAGMAKRTSPGPFETAPIAQGDLDGTGVPDGVTFPRGAQLGNPTKVLYSNIDVYQGTIVLWLTPEWDGNDGLTHWIFGDNNARVRCGKNAASNFVFYAGGTFMSVAAGAWTAGTTYCIIMRWDTKNTLDGTNSLSVTVNNVTTYGGVASSSLPPDTFLWVGSLFSTLGADSIIEGLTAYRRVLYNGTYGHDVNGGLDELTAIYNAGAGVDPTTLTGSNDVVFCLPTDSTAGALVTGTGEAWSHPLPGLIDDTFMDQGNMPGGDWAIGFDGATTTINCGSDASLDDLHGATLSVDISVRLDDDGEGGVSALIDKGRQIVGVGWAISISAGNIIAHADMDTDARSIANIVTNWGASIIDGKNHLVTAYLHNATRVWYIAVDGIWANTYVQQQAGVLPIVSDAAQDLFIGSSTTGTQTVDGALNWVELSDNDRHGGVAGTDFPENLPTAPFNDGNTIEAWDMEEGTGTNTVAMVNTPANDGTITAGTWEAVWNRELTPVEPVFVRTDVGDINYGSGINIDDLPAGGAITAETWASLDEYIGSNTEIFSKGFATSDGWTITTRTGGHIRGGVIYDGTNSLAQWNNAGVEGEKVLHHFAFTYDEGGDRKSRLFVDGILRGVGAASVGNYVTDAAFDCESFLSGLAGTSGWLRVSDSIRYTSPGDTIGQAYFVPNSWANPPANDANAQLLVNMNDGTGTTATDSSGNGYDGTLTGDAEWLNSTDMELIEPGAQMFHSGKVIGSDGALDGIKIQLEPTNPVDGVILPRISVGQDGRARVIVDYDGTQFKYPKFHGLHTGGAAIPCEDTDGAWSQHILGWTLYNITQNTSGVPTAIDGDGQGVTGGPNFNNGDEYLWRPPNGDNYCQHPIGAYGVWVSRTAAAVVELQVVNGAGEGSIQVHQMEVQESLIDNGDMETGAGNPYIVAGFANAGLAVGESLADAVILHSGTQSIIYNTAGGASQTQGITAALGSFVSAGVWGREAAGSVALIDNSGRIKDQATLATTLNVPFTGDVWALYAEVGRINIANPTALALRVLNAAQGHFDDLYVFSLNDITLTITPASEANSLEGTGIRVDGLDQLTQVIPVGRLQPQIGHIRVLWTPRHDDSDILAFGQTVAYVLRGWGDANNYFDAQWTAANNLRLAFNANGAGQVVGNWATGGGVILAGIQYALDIIYTPVWMRLYVGGILRIQIVSATGFVWPIPSTMYWGTDQNGIWQADAVIG